MSQPSEHQPMATASNAAVKVNNKLILAAVIFLFIVVIFIFFLYIYAKRRMGSNPLLLRQYPSLSNQIPVIRRGLDPQLLKSLPVTIFKPSESDSKLECAVCLCEVPEGEKARILPKCKHVFHVECIDMWFGSHSTCPLCRAPVTVESLAEFSVGITEEGGSSSLSSKKRLVIDIPERVTDDVVSPLPTSRAPMEEAKTPKLMKLRSLRRLLSRGKMVVGSYSPKGGDIEQGVGEGSSLNYKTPGKFDR